MPFEIPKCTSPQMLTLIRQWYSRIASFKWFLLIRSSIKSFPPISYIKNRILWYSFWKKDTLLFDKIWKFNGWIYFRMSHFIYSRLSCIYFSYSSQMAQSFLFSKAYYHLEWDSYITRSPLSPGRVLKGIIF